jgi:molecular chaperone GrpE
VKKEPNKKPKTAPPATAKPDNWQEPALVDDINDSAQIIEELTANLQMLQAEFANYKRRSEAERLAAVGFGKQQAAIVLLPILDNIERAIAHEPADIKNHQWVKGVASIASQLQGQLESLGLVRFGAVGDEFNPAIHEAVTMEESDGETELVAEVLQPGYKFGDAVIRPAMVKVVKN